MAPTVGDFLLERLKAWGIHRIYGYPGDGINGIMGALNRADGDPEFIQVRHEEMAAFMACAHAKFTGEIGGLPRHLRPRRHPPAQRPV
jgi:pyruvate dehydrogenase (quinone)